MVIGVKWLVAIGMIVIGSLVGYDAARILAVFPTPSHSHVISFQALTTELAARGHHLTVISSFPQKKTIPNYTDIVVPKNLLDMSERNMFDFAGLDIVSEYLIQLFLLPKISLQICEYYLEYPETQKLIRSEEKFDLMIMEVFFSECFLGFSHKLNVPVVGVVPNGGFHWILDFMGSPSTNSYFPSAFLSYSHRMNFLERIHNAVTITTHAAVRSFFTLPRQDEVMRKNFQTDAPLPYIADMERNISLVLLNSHFSLGYSRPYQPNIIEVGGMHIKTEQTLTQDLKQFMDESKEGVLYFSMGSNLKGYHLPETKRKALLDAFSKIKQRILWKWDEDSITGQPDNVKVGQWLPQPAILAHPKLRLFITHGGLLSIQEAVYHGVPLVGIPIFGDQHLNMNKVQQSGFGLILDFHNITTESVLWAINTIMNQPSFREEAKRISFLYHDQPMKPLETAVYWTEYVLTHGGARHLRSAALDLAWYQYYLLDVMGALALCLGFVVLAMYLIAKTLLHVVCGKRGSQKTGMHRAKKQK